jgi:TPR repeat protein
MSVPVYDFAIANENTIANENEKLETLDTETYYPCCGKTICGGCLYSCIKSGNYETCPYCKSDRTCKTVDEKVEDLMKRVEANDANSIYALGTFYYHGQLGLSQDQEKAKELLMRAAELGSSHAHCLLGNVHEEGGDLKKAKFHYESAAMAGNDVARFNLGAMEMKSSNGIRALKHFMIGASTGCFQSMHKLLKSYEKGIVSRDAINSTLTAYNNSCAEVRSEARDSYIRIIAMSCNGHL